MLQKSFLSLEEFYQNDRHVVQTKLRLLAILRYQLVKQLFVYGTK